MFIRSDRFSSGLKMIQQGLLRTGLIFLWGAVGFAGEVLSAPAQSNCLNTRSYGNATCGASAAPGEKGGAAGQAEAVLDLMKALKAQAGDKEIPESPYPIHPEPGGDARSLVHVPIDGAGHKAPAISLGKESPPSTDGAGAR